STVDAIARVDARAVALRQSGAGELAGMRLVDLNAERPIEKVRGIVHLLARVERTRVALRAARPAPERKERDARKSSLHTHDVTVITCSSCSFRTSKVTARLRKSRTRCCKASRRWESSARWRS